VLARILRWGVLMGGLAIVADLGTEVIQRQMGTAPDQDGVLVYVDLVLSAVFYSLAGRSVARETGGVAFGAIAGLLAGILDGVVVGAAVEMARGGRSEQQPDLLSLLTTNALLGFVLAGASAFFLLAAQRRGRGGSGKG
jgi:hypothetical protein